MGQAILYCFRCSTQLREAQFEAGKAYRIDAWVCCAACAPEAIRSLPADRVQVLLKLIAASQGKKAPPPLRDTSPRPFPAPPPAPAPAAAGSSKWILIGAGVAVAAAIGIAASLSGKPAPETPPVRAEAPATRPAARVVPPLPPTDSPERQALKKAQQYAREHPDDLEGQLREFGDLMLLADQSEVGAEARRTREALNLRQRQLVEKGLATLEAELAVPLRRAEFGTAIRSLEAARSRIPGTQWTLALEKREGEIRDQAFAAFEGIKEKAREARLKGNAADVDAAVARVRSWGFEKLVADLDRVLAGSEAPRPATPAAPEPARSAESKAYLALWEQSMARALSRDYAAAAADLERAASTLKEDAVKKEAADDLRDLKELDRAYQATLAAFASSKMLELRTIDDQTVSGRVLSMDADRVEIVVEPLKPTVFVEWSDVRTSTLAALLRAQNPDPRALQLFERIEGLPRPKPSADDLRARELYYEAERGFREMATREKAVDAYKQLRQKFKDTGLVRRAAQRIERRSESGKEYYFLASDLAYAGTFSLSKDGRLESLADSDPAQANRNWAEWEFLPLPSTSYRCWALLGGCCAEAFAAHVQATGLTELNPKTKKRAPAEPGGDLASPLKVSIKTLKPAHPKGEPQKPTRWEWVEVPLPRASAPGTRKVRLLTDQRGFAVASVVVSASRSRAPTEAEASELAKVRALDAVPAWARPGGIPKILLDDFEQGVAAWKYISGQEFPGAKGSMTHDSSVGREGKGSLKLSGDFTGGGGYVGNWRDFAPGSDFKELRFWLRTDTAVRFMVRIVDGTEQCHQRDLTLVSTRDWQEVVLNFEKIAGDRHWGGPNDGKWRGRARAFGINVVSDGFAGGKAGDVWIDDVEAVLNVEPATDR